MKRVENLKNLICFVCIVISIATLIFAGCGESESKSVTKKSTYTVTGRWEISLYSDSGETKSSVSVYLQDPCTSKAFIDTYPIKSIDTTTLVLTIGNTEVTWTREPVSDGGIFGEWTTPDGHIYDFREDDTLRVSNIDCTVAGIYSGVNSDDDDNDSSDGNNDSSDDDDNTAGTGTWSIEKKTNLDGEESDYLSFMYLSPCDDKLNIEGVGIIRIEETTLVFNELHPEDNWTRASGDVDDITGEWTALDSTVYSFHPSGKMTISNLPCD